MAKISLTLADGRVLKTAAGRSLYDISRDSQSGAQGLILAASLNRACVRWMLSQPLTPGWNGSPTRPRAAAKFINAAPLSS